MDRVIGIDFDNTLVSYDALLHRVAVQRGVIPHQGVTGKRQIRDYLRQQMDGEVEWQRLQGIVYGPRMGEAALIQGVAEFFQSSRQHGSTIFVISHKTEFANYDETRTPLRDAALDWMDANRFFSPVGLGLPRSAIYFENTRREKIERIVRLGCTHFIDDLEETFYEPSFPVHVRKILFAPDPPRTAPAGVKIMTTWQEINEQLYAGMC